MTARKSGISAPNPPRRLHDHSELCPLLFLGEEVAFLRRGEAALRAEAELVHRDVTPGLVDAAADVVGLLQHAALRGDETQHDPLRPRLDEAQRLEAAGAPGVVFQEEAVDPDAPEQGLSHRLLAAFRDPGGAEIAAADM